MTGIGFLHSIDRRRLISSLAVLPLVGAFSGSGWAQETALSEPEEGVVGPEDGAVVGPVDGVAGQGPVSLITQAGRTVSGFFTRPQARPDGAKAPCLLLIHDWWGLSDEVKAVAAACAVQGYATLSVDLYDGVVPGDTASAGFAMRNVVREDALDALISWVNWLKDHELCNGKVGVCGWSFGAGWALALSSQMPVDATVLYYGNVENEADQLALLSGPVLAHFGRNDVFVDEAMVEAFKQAMEEAEKSVTLHIYDVGHGFANPSAVRYDEQNAKLAWARSLAFFESHLN